MTTRCYESSLASIIHNERSINDRHDTASRIHSTQSPPCLNDLLTAAGKESKAGAWPANIRLQPPANKPSGILPNQNPEGVFCSQLSALHHIECYCSPLACSFSYSSPRILYTSNTVDRTMQPSANSPSTARRPSPAPCEKTSGTH